MLQFLENILIWILLLADRTIASLGINYSLGFAIISLTLFVKFLVLPLVISKRKSDAKMQFLERHPQWQQLKKEFSNDREKLAQEQMRVYRNLGLNPFAGCLPQLIQFPIWIGLYRAIRSTSLFSACLCSGGESFFWLPSLAGPIKRLSGGPTWLLPNNQDFIGWGNVARYLVIPILLIITQFYVCVNRS